MVVFSELRQEAKREKLDDDIRDFMQADNRFTLEDGILMCQHLRDLGRRLQIPEPMKCIFNEVIE